MAVHASKRTAAGGLTSGVAILTPFHLGLTKVDVPDAIAKPAREIIISGSGEAMLAAPLW